MGAQGEADAAATVAGSKPESPNLPKGRIGKLEFSRLMMGGNLIAIYAHARDLPYVSSLMRRYNTPAKIRETLELGEQNGITAINPWVMDDNSQLFEHRKNGGKLQWVAQVRLSQLSGGEGGFAQVDQGAATIPRLTPATAGSVFNQ